MILLPPGFRTPVSALSPHGWVTNQTPLARCFGSPIVVARRLCNHRPAVPLLRLTVGSLTFPLESTAVRPGAHVVRNDVMQGVLRGLWARRAHFAPLILLEAAGIAALFIAVALFDGILLRPLRFPDADALVQIWHGQPKRGASHLFLTFEEAEFYRQEAASLESSVAFTTGDAFVTEADATTSIRIVRVLGDLCQVLRIPPIAGRCLTAADAALGAPHVAVIRAGRATSRYEHPARALGSSVRIDDMLYQVVGVVSDDLQLRAFGGFLYGRVDYMVPLSASPTGAGASTGRHMLIARLASGSTFFEAASELEALSRAYATQAPNANDDKVAELWSLYHETVQYARPQSRAIVAGAVLLALLVVFNSALLRAAEIRRRRSTLAIKVALGASSRRLVGEELAAALGSVAITGFVAWSLASVLVARFVRTEPWGLPGLRQEAFPFYFAIALLLVCGIGTVATLVYVRRNVASREAVGMLPVRVIGESRRVGRWSRAMVAAQCAMAVVLVGTTLLLLKTMWNLAHVNVGVRTENLLIVQAMLPRRLADTPMRRQLALDRLLDSGAQPGPAGIASLVNSMPLTLRGELRRVDVAGVRDTKVTSAFVDYRVVSPNYFQVAGIQILGGRIPAGYNESRAAEFVVNHAFVRRYLEGREPAGIPLSVFPDVAQSGVELHGIIVGVVADVRHWGPDRPASAEVYVLYQPDPPTKFALLFRPTGSPEEAALAIRERLRLVAPELAAFPVSTMTAIAHAALGMRRFASALFGVFATVAVLVTALGLYGLTAGYVATRRAEIAVRVTVGAGRRSVATLVARQALVPAAIGCVAGTGALMATGRVLRSWLYDVSPTDPSLLLVLPLAMAAVAIAATLAPLFSALKVAPIELLRRC